jgi:hypothetical protein
MLSGTKDILIGRVRIQGVSADLPLTRLRTAQFLQTANLYPSALPPAAVLVVKEFSDSKLKPIAARWDAVRVQSDWERYARDRLTALYLHATHAANQAVSANSDAVVFNDESELLACLLRDLTEETVLRHWWWKAVLRSGWIGRKPSSHREVVEAAVQQMVQKAHLIPSILSQLDIWRQAVPAMRLLSTEQAKQILSVVLQAYKLPALPEKNTQIFDFHPLPPWTADRNTLILGKERSTLLALSLDIYKHPQTVRTTSYQNQLRSWWITADSDLETPSLKMVNTEEPTPIKSSMYKNPETMLAKDKAGNVETSFAREILKSDEDQTQSQLLQKQTEILDVSNELRTASADKVVASSSQEKHFIFGDIKDQVSSADQESKSLQSKHRKKSVSPTKVEGQRQVIKDEDELEVQASESQLHLSAWLSGGVPTRLGGVLYLINLMISLDLPDCFEEDWHLSSQLGPWSLLEMLARALLGDDIEGLEGDPLWVALAQLDGRGIDEPPGVRLPRSRPRYWLEFQLPEHWLSGLPPEADQLHRSRRMPKRYRSLGASPWLQRWLWFALPFIAYRLRLALNLLPDAGLAETLLILPGRLYVTSSHVDLSCSIEQVSLPVRMAGLDRDPGWLPEFGRVVSFHFLE